MTARLQRCEEDWMKGVREAKEQNNKVTTHTSHHHTQQQHAMTWFSDSPRWRSCTRRCTHWKRRRS